MMFLNRQLLVLVNKPFFYGMEELILKDIIIKIELFYGAMYGNDIPIIIKTGAQF